jgi:trans-aconitate methyltransferase
MTQWDATDYAKNSQGQLAWALALVDRLKLGEASRVLDVGCGDGKVSAEIARRVPAGRVVGIDNSPAMIELAQRTWASVVPNLEFRIADAQAFDVPSSFDLVFSNSALHWMPDHPAVLRCVAAGLKSGGRLAFSMGGRGTASVVYRAIDELRQEAPWARFLAGARSPHYFFRAEDYNKWLPEAGFKPLRVVLTPKPMRHSTSDALAGWLRTVWMPYTDRIPIAERMEFLNELTLRVRTRCERADDGALLLPMVNLEVEAEKMAV